MTGQFLIYALVDPRTGKRFYVGQSSRGLERCREHFTPFAMKEQTVKARVVRRIVNAGRVVKIEVLQYISDPDEAVPPLLKFYDAAHDWGALDAAEMRWIAYGREAGWPLTNATDGGDGLRGLVRTAEHCAKISASQKGNQYAKGYKATPEHRAKLSAAKKGLIRSAEHAAKIGAANRGKPKHTEEHKQLLRERFLGPGNPTRGKKASPELRAKLSAAHIGVQAGAKNPNYGKKMSDEQKAKISATKRARPWTPSDEVRRKLRESVRGELHPMFGKAHSDEAKKRIGDTKRRRLELGRWLAYQLAGISQID